MTRDEMKKAFAPFDVVRVKVKEPVVGRDYLVNGEVKRLYEKRGDRCKVGTPGGIDIVWVDCHLLL